MPLNFPDNWGIRNKWRDLSEPKPKETNKKRDVYNRTTGKMKCPECGAWIDYFNYAEDRIENGTIDALGDIDFCDSEYAGTNSISCPACGEVVFGSNIARLIEYYEA